MIYIFDLAKKYKITLKELSVKGLSPTYLSKINKNHNSFKVKHIPLLCNSFNSIFEKRGLNIRLEENKLLEQFLFTPKKQLDKIVDDSIKSKDIYKEKYQDQISNFEKKHEVHSLKFRYIIAKYKQKNEDTEKALYFYYELLKNFDCLGYFYSILIEVFRIEKNEKVEDLYVLYKSQINRAPYKIKSLLLYIVAEKLDESKKWNKAITFFEKVIKINEDTKQKSYSYKKIKKCLSNLEDHLRTIDDFSKLIKKLSKRKDFKISFVNKLKPNETKEKKTMIDEVMKDLSKIEAFVEKDEFDEIYNSFKMIEVYLDDKEASIKRYEHEVFNPNLCSKSFDISNYLFTIELLIALYGRKPIKQQELIEQIKKIDIKLLTPNFIKNVLKYYLNHQLEYEAKIFINIL